MASGNDYVLEARPPEINLENLHSFEKRNVFRGRLDWLNRKTRRMELIDVAIKEPVFQHDGRMRLKGIKKDTYKKQIETIKHEAIILTRLSNNENIVRSFGLCYNPMSLVLEFCEGGTLMNVYDNLRYSVAYTVINWAKQVATGMLHLHDREQALVHADLKAENILIKERPCLGRQALRYPCMNTSYDSSGNCLACGGRSLDKLTLKITDFGLARDVSSQWRSFDGSVPWMAPERIAETEFTKPGDVWSFGVLFWEIMMNLRPYSNEKIDHMALAYAIAKRKENVRLKIPEKCPGPIKSMLEGCWNYEPNERPTFKEIISLLDSAMQYLRSKDGNENWTFNVANTRTPTITNMDIHRIVEEMHQIMSNQHLYANVRRKRPAPRPDSVGPLRSENLHSSCIPTLDSTHIRVLQRVGGGFTSQVFKAIYQNATHEEIVAVKKIMNIGSYFDRDDVMREIGLISSCRHANIVRFIGHYSDRIDQAIHIVTEFMEGGDLHTYLHNAENKPTMRLAFSHVMQLVDGMIYLTKQHIIHRDLATRNCM